MTKQIRYCPVCNARMIYVNHWEYDGDQGSHEPYYKCPNECEKQIDTCTEYGSIMYGLIMTEESPESVIL